MGILNLTTDSFSDGRECLNVNDAIAKARSLIEQGAQIIDIGAESTNIHSKPIDVEKEISAVVPIVAILKKEYPHIVLSVDTRNSKTAKAIVLAGADMINDVSGFSWDSEILKVAIDSDKKYVLMHSRGTPENMDSLCDYQNVIEDVYREIREKMLEAIRLGMKLENIIIDPGFGFAKNGEQNLALLKHIEEFKSLGAQVLVGISRKRFLVPFSIGETPKERDDATMLGSFYACLKGVDIVRVHNVALTKNALNFATMLSL